MSAPYKDIEMYNPKKCLSSGDELGELTNSVCLLYRCIWLGYLYKMRVAESRSAAWENLLTVVMCLNFT